MDAEQLERIIRESVRISHWRRCAIHGCVYDGQACAYCLAPKPPSHHVIGQSPLATIRDRTDGLTALLVASVRELREALMGAMRVCYVNGLTDAFVEEIERLGIKDNIGVRALAAIAKYEEEIREGDTTKRTTD